MKSILRVVMLVVVVMLLGATSLTAETLEVEFIFERPENTRDTAEAVGFFFREFPAGTTPPAFTYVKSIPVLAGQGTISFVRRVTVGVSWEAEARGVDWKRSCGKIQWHWETARP